MRFYQTWLVALFFVLAAHFATASDCSVDIVPESSGGKDKQGINVWRTFHVVLANISSHDLMVWNEACSWGYFNLSFEFTNGAGKVVKVHKEPTGFTVNFPNGYVVSPEKHFVLAVKFLDPDRTDIKEWSNTDDLVETMTMKAIYKNTNEAYPGEKTNPDDQFPPDMQKQINLA